MRKNTLLTLILLLFLLVACGSGGDSFDAEKSSYGEPSETSVVEINCRAQCLKNLRCQPDPYRRRRQCRRCLRQKQCHRRYRQFVLYRSRHRFLKDRRQAEFLRHFRCSYWSFMI